jgi:hypothetical protein
MANEFGSGPGGLTTYFANHDSGWQAAAFAGALAQGALEKQENPTTPPMPS